MKYSFIPNLTTKSQLELSEKKLINAYKRCYLTLQEKIFEFIKHHPEKKEEWLKKSKELGENYLGILKDKMAKPTTIRLTIDRIDNNIGYKIDNIILACGRCNLIKSNFFSLEEMREIGQKYVKAKWEK